MSLIIFLILQWSVAGADATDKKMLLGRAIAENGCAAVLLNACGGLSGSCSPASDTEVLDHGFSRIDPLDAPGHAKPFQAGIGVTGAKDGFLISLGYFEPRSPKVVKPVFKPGLYFCAFKGELLKKPLSLNLIVQTGLSIDPLDRFTFSVYFDPRVSPRWSVNSRMLDDLSLLTSGQTANCYPAGASDEAKVHATYLAQRSRFDAKAAATSPVVCSVFGWPLLYCADAFERLGDLNEAKRFFALRDEAGCSSRTGRGRIYTAKHPPTATSVK